MTDDENGRGDAEGINEGFEGRTDAGTGGGGRASAQAQGSEGDEGATGEQGVAAGGEEERRSNLGDWDPSRQGGGGGEVY